MTRAAAEGGSEISNGRVESPRLLRSHRVPLRNSSWVKVTHSVQCSEPLDLALGLDSTGLLFSAQLVWVLRDFDLKSITWAL